MGRKVLRKGEAPQAQHTALYDRITKIEVEVLDRIQELKAKPPKPQLCSHLARGLPEPHNYAPEQNYYDLYWKQYLLNELGVHQAQQLRQQVAEMQRKLKKIETLFQRREQELQPFQASRQRRDQESSQPSRERQQQLVACMMCGRSYKDEDTLLLHQKIKHGGEMARERANREGIFQSSQDK